jgi:hypothetical protein
MVLDGWLLILPSGPALLPFSKHKGTHCDWAEGRRCGALRKSSVLHCHAIVTRRTLPPSSELEPGIGEAAAPVKMLPFADPFSWYVPVTTATVPYTLTRYPPDTRTS